MTRLMHLMTALATIFAGSWQSAPSRLDIDADQPTDEETEIVESAVGTAYSRQSPRTDTDPFHISLEGLTAEQVEIVESAVGTFADAGLPLPFNLTISFHEISAPCERGAGAYRPATGQISICSVHRDPAVARARQRRVLVHELAHAWTENFLQPQPKEAFLELRGAEAWRSPDLRWRERGTEQAADIITWGILDSDILFLTIDDTSCEELDEAFRVLTGLVPTAGLSHNCER